MRRLAPDQLLLQRAYHFERTMPERPYLTQPMGGGRIEQYSWKRTLDEARRIAAYIQAQGFPPGSNIAILSKNCAHFIMTDLAIWMAGHVSVALFPTLEPKSVRYILEHSEAKLLFVGKLDTWDTMRAGVPEQLPQVTYPLSPPSPDLAEKPSWDALVRDTEPLREDVAREPDDLAIIVYTSGSTGQPKGVMHSFHNMAVAAWYSVEEGEVTRDERMLSYLPLAHVFERWIVESLSLVAGFQVFFAESIDTFVQDLVRARPTQFVSVPRLWLKFQQGVFTKLPQAKLEQLMRIPIVRHFIRKKVLRGLGLDAVRRAGTGSAPIPESVVEWYRGLGLELLEGYGMSENFCYSHASRDESVRVGYVGEPHEAVECRISDAGEILVKSPANMLGYYKQPELSAASFTEDGFLKTGDRGEVDAQGRLKITGRIKEQFKTSKGKYVAPAPIENLLIAAPDLELACVAGSGRVAAHAVVQLAEELLPTREDPQQRARLEAALSSLREQVNAQLDHHEHLAFLVVAREPWSVDNGCLTPTLKIRRSQIEARYAEAVESWYGQGQALIWE